MKPEFIAAFPVTEMLGGRTIFRGLLLLNVRKCNENFEGISCLKILFRSYPSLWFNKLKEVGRPARPVGCVYIQCSLVSLIPLLFHTRSLNVLFVWAILICTLILHTT
jgi:hypothetical protein